MPRFLLVTSCSPLPPTAGDRQRTNLLYRALAKLGTTDLLLLNHPPYFADVEPELRRHFGLQHIWEPRRRGEHGLWRVIRPVHPRWVDRLAHNFGRRSVDYRPDPVIGPRVDEMLRRQRYDLIVGRYLQPTAWAGVLRHPSVIVDVDDLDTEVYASRLHVPGQSVWAKMMLRRHLTQLERIVPGLLSRAAHLWLASPADCPRVQHTSVSVLPNIPFIVADRPLQPWPEEPECRTILTVASLTHRVNVKGIERFIREVWPAIRGQCPTAVFRVVGSGMSAEMRRRWAAVTGVEPIGFMEDLQQAYRDCAFTIAPLYEGGGTKIKVLESLAYGRTCVATPHAQRGYESVLRHQEALWVAHNEADFSAGCVRLLQDRALRRCLSACGQQQVERFYSFAAVCREVAATVERITARGKAIAP